MRSDRYFSWEDIFIIFRYLWTFITISIQMFEYHDGHVVLIKKYLNIFYRICNSLSLSKILPLIDITSVVTAAHDIHDLYELPEAEPVRHEAVKLLMIISKIVYFYAPEFELAKCMQTFNYYSLDQPEYFVMKMIPMFRTPKDFSEAERNLWRGFMSRRKFSGRDDVLKQNNGECIVCTDNFIGDDFFILSCCHAVCEDCLQLLMKESHQRYVSLHLYNSPKFFVIHRNSFREYIRNCAQGFETLHYGFYYTYCWYIHCEQIIIFVMVLYID